MVKFWNKGWENIYPDSNPGRGSLKVVVRELWSTKYRTPSAVYFISQPGGRGCSLIILQQGEGGSEHGPSRRREPCAGGGPAGHTSLEKYTEWIWRIWKLFGACWAQKKKSQGGHSLRSQRWREHLEGRLMAEMLFTTSLNVDWMSFGTWRAAAVMGCCYDTSGRGKKRLFGLNLERFIPSKRTLFHMSFFNFNEVLHWCDFHLCLKTI